MRWIAAIEAAGLPVAWTEGARPRPRIAFGAPLPVGMAANAELIDVVMTERWPAWRVREALDRPRAGRLAPRRARGRLARRARRSPAGSPRPTTGSRCAGTPPMRTVSARPRPTCSRRRDCLASARRGDGTVEYDLRPLLIDVAVAGRPARRRDDPHALPPGARHRPTRRRSWRRWATRLGDPLEIESIVRERLVLVEDLG